MNIVSGRGRIAGRLSALFPLLLMAITVGLLAPPSEAYREERNDRRDAYRFLRLPRERADRLRELQERVDRDHRRLQERLE